MDGQKTKKQKTMTELRFEWEWYVLRLRRETVQASIFRTEREGRSAEEDQLREVERTQAMRRHLKHVTLQP